MLRKARNAFNTTLFATVLFSLSYLVGYMVHNVVLAFVPNTLLSVMVGGLSTVLMLFGASSLYTPNPGGRLARWKSFTETQRLGLNLFYCVILFSIVVATALVVSRIGFSEVARVADDVKVLSFNSSTTRICFGTALVSMLVLSPLLLLYTFHPKPVKA